MIFNGIREVIHINSTIVILRGNSGSGKTTVAKDLQKLLGHNTLMISQDVIRRQMLYAKDGPDSPAISLLINLIEYGKKHYPFVILEGIMNSKWYKPLFQVIQEEYSDSIHAYYFDLPFEETLKRHETKPNHNEFGENEIRRWWNEKDYIGFIPEIIIGKEQTEERIVTMIMNELN